MFGAPTATPYDLRFSVAGIPVRVHPLFWLISILFGFRPNDPIGIAIWVGAIFISILIHELGHAFTMRYFGYSPAVVLYAGGGLAMYHGDNDSPWTNYSAGYFNRRRENPWSRILVSAAGPAAGFLFAALVIAVAIVAGVGLTFFGERITGGTEVNPYLFQLLGSLLFINIIWGMVNLLPIYPLDGGQISRELFQMYSRDGVRQSLWLSLITAAGVAMFGFYIHSMFIGIMFAYFAVMNWQMINMTSGGGGFGGYGGYGGDRW